MGKVTPEKVLRFTTTVVRICAGLPPLPTAKNWEITRYKIHWWCCFCFSWTISLPVMYDLHLKKGDINSILLNAAELCPLCGATLKLLLCKWHGPKIRECIAEVKSFVTSATPRERKVLQSYIDRSIEFHYLMLFCIICTTLGFSTSHIFSPQPYPAHTSYPFPVETVLLKNILRVLQMLVLVQTGFLVTMDFKFSSLVWLTAARFELLSEEIRKVSNREEFFMWIRKHQKILQFAEDVNFLTRFMAYGVGLSTAIGTICGSIQLMRDVSLMIRVRFVSFVIVGILELLVYCWPAEYLMKNSGAIAFSAYSSEWVGQSPEMTRLILMVMQRARKPMVISVGNFLPILSLNCYGSFLSTSFSYFTTLRATTTSGI